MASENAIEKLARGVYGSAEAARIAHLEPRRVRRWLDGYDFKSRAGDLRHSGPVFPREHQGGASVALTFMDLIEVLYVAAFLSHGVSMHTVRLVHGGARDEFNVRHPFAIKRFETDGRSIFQRFAEADDGAHGLLDRKRYQYVFREVFDPLMKRIDYGTLSEEAERYWPLGRDNLVLVDPRVAFGEPVVGRRVPTRVVYNAVRRSGDPKDRIARWYSISMADIDAAIAYEESVARSKRAA